MCKNMSHNSKGLIRIYRKCVVRLVQLTEAPKSSDLINNPEYLGHNSISIWLRNVLLRRQLHSALVWKKNEKDLKTEKFHSHCWKKFAQFSRDLLNLDRSRLFEQLLTKGKPCKTFLKEHWSVYSESSGNCCQNIMCCEGGKGGLHSLCLGERKKNPKKQSI